MVGLQRCVSNLDSFHSWHTASRRPRHAGTLKMRVRWPCSYLSGY